MNFWFSWVMILATLLTNSQELILQTEKLEHAPTQSFYRRLPYTMKLEQQRLKKEQELHD